MNDDVKKALERQAAAVAALREEQREAERGEQEAWRQTDAMRVERDALRAQLAEALEALRAQEAYGCLCAMAEHENEGPCGQCAMRRDVLAKAGRR